MKHVIAAVALICMSGAATLSFAQEAKKADPNGTWKWSTERGGVKREMTLKLKLEGDKLTGTLVSPGRGEGAAPTETAIEEATIKDADIAFKVTREFQGNKFTSTYTAKIDGDVMKGSVERPGRDGQTSKTDFEAKREKKEEPKK